MKEKDPRLSKQLGDFGEQLAMFILGRIKGYTVACVDHVGADLIAEKTDKNGKRHAYAISVKTRVIGGTETKQQHFDQNQQDKLRWFAGNYNMIPAVAFIFCEEVTEKEDFNIDVCMIDLDELIAMADLKEYKDAVTRSVISGNINFKNTEKAQRITQKNPDKFMFQRLVVKKSDVIQTHAADKDGKGRS